MKNRLKAMNKDARAFILFVYRCLYQLLFLSKFRHFELSLRYFSSSMPIIMPDINNFNMFQIYYYYYCYCQFWYLASFNIHFVRIALSSLIIILNNNFDAYDFLCVILCLKVYLYSHISYSYIHSLYTVAVDDKT